jgi:MFS family permease
MFLDGITFVPYHYAHSLTAVYVVTLLHAFAIPMIVVSRATIIQRLVPREMLGRAFGYIDIAVFGVTALSAGVTGYLVEKIGPADALVYGGAIAALCGLLALALGSISRIRFDDAESVPAEALATHGA